MRPSNFRKPIGRYAFHAGCNRVFRRVGGRHRRLRVRGVNQLLARDDLRDIAVDQRRDFMRTARPRTVFVHRQPSHAT